MVRSPTLTKRPGIDGERLETAQPARRRDRRQSARREAGHRVGDGANVLGGGAAAPAHHVDEAARGKVGENLRGLARGLIVFAEGIRQTRVRIGAHVGVGDTRELLDVRSQLFAAERAVEAHRRRTHVTDGVPEGLGGLAGQSAPRRIGDRSRHDDRQLETELIEGLADGE